jgi:thiamine biosynthesis protein ThiI
MAMGLILIRYGEIALKGKNRPYFVGRLRKNIRDCLKKNGLSGDVRTVGQRLYVHTDEVEKAADKLRTSKPSKKRPCAWQRLWA